MNKKEIRLEKVSYHLLRGTSETKIAEILKVSRQTIVRDAKCLKESSQSWLDGLAKGGFIFEYKSSLDKIKGRYSELQKLYDNTTNTEQKLKILKSMDDNDKMYLQLLGEGPVIQAMRQFKNGGM